MSARPLLYLDVDGPLNPFAAKPENRPAGYLTHRMTPPSWLAQHPARPLRVWLDPAHGPALLAVAEHFDLWWATTWEHDANTHIGPVLGLPELPVVEWTPTRRGGSDGTCWKTAELVRHAAGRSWAWVDDEITVRDRRFVHRHHSGAALLHHVEPAKGLRDSDFAALTAWARQRRRIESGEW